MVRPFGGDATHAAVMHRPRGALHVSNVPRKRVNHIHRVRRLSHLSASHSARQANLAECAAGKLYG